MKTTPQRHLTARAQPVPAAFALLRAGARKPTQYESLADLAGRVESARQNGEALRLERTTVSWPGFAPFPAVNIYIAGEGAGGFDAFLACAWIGGQPVEVLEAALRRAAAAAT